MSFKKKLLGLGLLACLAAVPLLMVNASASNRLGHFVTTGTVGANIYGVEGAGHMVEWKVDGVAGGIVCDKSGWQDVFETETKTEIYMIPAFSECHTTGSATKFAFKNNCTFIFYVAQGTTDSTEQTLKLACSAPSEILDPTCTIKVTSQDNLTGITYTTITSKEKHAITVDLNVAIAVETAGTCGAGKKTGRIVGSLTLEADNAKTGASANLTAT